MGGWWVGEFSIEPWKRRLLRLGHHLRNSLPLFGGGWVGGIELVGGLNGLLDGIGGLAGGWVSRLWSRGTEDL